MSAPKPDSPVPAKMKKPAKRQQAPAASSFASIDEEGAPPGAMSQMRRRSSVGSSRWSSPCTPPSSLSSVALLQLPPEAEPRLPYSGLPVGAHQASPRTKAAVADRRRDRFTKSAEADPRLVSFSAMRNSAEVTISEQEREEKRQWRAESLSRREESIAQVNVEREQERTRPVPTTRWSAPNPSMMWSICAVIPDGSGPAAEKAVIVHKFWLG